MFGYKDFNHDIYKKDNTKWNISTDGNWEENQANKFKLKANVYSPKENNQT